MDKQANNFVCEYGGKSEPSMTIFVIETLIGALGYLAWAGGMLFLLDPRLAHVGWNRWVIAGINLLAPLGVMAFLAQILKRRDIRIAAWMMFIVTASIVLPILPLFGHP
ncbi:MAG TPA: hypothetical protein VHM90_22845 [Phycisphaerae bacterium]|nr:hypothetical protein [Phycisphaerae bacterium]